MGTRICLAFAAAALLSCAACGLLPATSSTTATQKPQGVTAPHNATPGAAATATSEAPSAVYASPSPAVSRTARRFVLRIAGYDTAHEGRRDFLSDLRDICTGSEWDALARSARARLPWRVLRARAESAHLLVTGLSRALPSRSPALRVVVQGVLTTRSNLAVVRSFEHFTLTLTRQRGVWLVSRAEGPGI